MIWPNYSYRCHLKILSSFDLCNLILMFLYQYMQALLDWGFSMVGKHLPSIYKATGSSSCTANKNNQGSVSYTCLHLKVASSASFPKILLAKTTNS